MTRLQKSLSTTWVNFRRLVLFLFGTLLVLGAARNLWLVVTGQARWYFLLIAIGTLTFAYFIFWVGVYGAVSRFAPMAMDLASSRQMHAIRKRKFRWKW